VAHSPGNAMAAVVHRRGRAIVGGDSYRVSSVVANSDEKDSRCRSRGSVTSLVYYGSLAWMNKRWRWPEQGYRRLAHGSSGRWTPLVTRMEKEREVRFVAL
jgi:hypothetical protein